MKLSFGERLSYALGDFSNNGAYMFVGTFLITFLTIGMGLSGKAAGAIIMCVTIFDAINDVIIGSIVDKAHGRGAEHRHAGGQKRQKGGIGLHARRRQPRQERSHAGEQRAQRPIAQARHSPV